MGDQKRDDVPMTTTIHYKPTGREAEINVEPFDDSEYDKMREVLAIARDAHDMIYPGLVAWDRSNPDVWVATVEEFTRHEVTR